MVAQSECSHSHSTGLLISKEKLILIHVAVRLNEKLILKLSGYVNKTFSFHKVIIQNKNLV